MPTRALLLLALACTCSIAVGCERDCTPPCRSGFICVKAECKSACNPPCPADKLCRAGECFVDDSMPTPDVVIAVPLTTDSGVPPPPPPPPPVTVGIAELGCMGEEADGYRKCTSKPGEAMVARFVEKQLVPLGDCLKELVGRVPAAAGKLVIRADFDFAAGGGPEALSVPEDTIADDAFKKCVVKVARKLYGSDCCDYYLRMTLPLYFNMWAPEAGGGTAVPGTGAPATGSASASAPASTALPSTALPSSALPASATSHAPPP